MNWYKKSQQRLMFYPFGKSPSEATEDVPPINVDPKTGEKFYKCHSCGKVISEKETEWYRDKEGKGKQYSLPQYNWDRVLEGITALGNYLTPFYQQLQEYISNNNDYDSTLYSWEVQIPGLSQILNQYPEIQELRTIRDSYGYMGNLNLFFSGHLTEINGQILKAAFEEMFQNPSAYVNNLKQTVEKEYKTFDIDLKVPICEECYEGYEKCEICDKILTPDMQRYETVGDWGKVCEECIENGNADVCGECGKVDSYEDMHYNENEGVMLCDKCYKERSNEYIGWAKDQISELNLPIGKNPPISKKILTNLNTFLNDYINKYGDNRLDQNEKEKILYLAQKRRLTEGGIEYLEQQQKEYNEKHIVSNLLGDVKNNVEAQDYISNKYPEIKKYQDIPFDIDVVESYSSEKAGFTITITPSENFFDYASKKYPNIEKVWDIMSRTPHHSGVLAYARCAYDGSSNLVINNLQRDADYDNYESSRGGTGLSSIGNKDYEAAKWMDNITKYWDVFLLDIIKSIGIKENINCYLTTFDQQKQKWGNLPIHKSKKSYEKIPKQMGMPLKSHDAERLVEQDVGDEDMYQVADEELKMLKQSMNWYEKNNIKNIMSSDIIISNNKKDKKLVKLAYMSKDHDTNFNNNGVSDGYHCKIQLTESKNRITLTANFLSDIMAFPLFTQTWTYPKNEIKRAIKTFNRNVNVIEDIKAEYEDDELPGPSLQGLARETLRFVDIDRKLKAPSRSLEAAKYLEGETDWRSSIYGNRMPEQQFPSTVNINNHGTVNFSGG